MLWNYYGVMNYPKENKIILSRGLNYYFSQIADVYGIFPMDGIVLSRDVIVNLT